MKKKDGMMRLIIDCRLANRRFRTPPGMMWTNPECLARLEAPAGRSLCEAGVENCHHNLRVGPALSRYFAWPPIRAGQLGLCSVEGCR